MRRTGAGSLHASEEEDAQADAIHLTLLLLLLTMTMLMRSVPEVGALQSSSCFERVAVGFVRELETADEDEERAGRTEQLALHEAAAAVAAQVPRTSEGKMEARQRQRARAVELKKEGESQDQAAVSECC